MTNKKNLKVAIISCFSDPLSPLGGRQAGGVSVYIYDLVRALSKAGVSVDVFTRWENRKTDQIVKIAQRGRVIRLKAGPRHFIPHEEVGVYMPDFIEHVLSFARENKIKYDLIHSHQYISGMVALQLKYILKIPLIHSFHSLGKVKAQVQGCDETLERYEVEQQILKKADKIIATSPQEKIDIINLYESDDEKVSIVPAGVNLKRFSKLNLDLARKKTGIAKEKKVIVFAARMDINKGGLTLIQAIKKIKTYYKSIFKNLEVHIFSGDPRKSRSKEKKEANFRKKMNSEISRLGLSKTIKLSPALDQEKLHYYYSSANAVIMPSYYESFGLVAAEAMASGTPVIASNVGGLRWVVQDGITGFHAEPNNPKQFAQKIVEILIDKKLEERLRENCAIYAHQTFNWDNSAAKIKGIYESELAKNSWSQKVV